MVIRMPAILRINTVDVDRRLDDLSWTREELLEVADSMIAARFSCTDNDPLSAPGWMSWKEGTRRLRELGRSHGFENTNEDQIPWVSNLSQGIRFAVANTDAETGLAGRGPQNNSRKGAATDRVIAENEALLFSEAELSRNVVALSQARQHPGIVVSWYLCVYTNGETMRVELSCPTVIEGGYFVDFHERLVLKGPEDQGPKVSKIGDRDSSNEFDISVTKK